MRLWMSSKGQKSSATQSQRREWPPWPHGSAGSQEWKDSGRPPPKHTHSDTHSVNAQTTEATMGILERASRNRHWPAGAKDSGCAWNFGSCFSRHIPHFSPNNKLCHRPHNSPHSGHLSPQKASVHSKPHANLLNSGDLKKSSGTKKGCYI